MYKMLQDCKIFIDQRYHRLIERGVAVLGYNQHNYEYANLYKQQK
jgi:hypothetical protein